MGAYHRAISSANPGFDLTGGGHRFQSDAATPGSELHVFIQDDLSDNYHAGSAPGNAPLANGSIVSGIFLNMYDPSGTALNSSALSATPPNASAFQYKDLYIDGRNATATDYFNVSATVNSIVVANGAPSDGLIRFKVTAQVRDVWDSYGVLNGAVNVGDLVTGTYAFNPNTPDSDTRIEFGRYKHVPDGTRYGFDITVGGNNFKSDPMQPGFVVEIGDNDYGYDHYDVFSFTNQPLGNGVSVDHIGLHLFDQSGVALSSANLSNTPPQLLQFMVKDLVFGGHRASWESFHLAAEILSIELLVADDKGPVAISPSDGMFDRTQHFEPAFIFEPGLAGVTHLRGTLNGFDVGGYLYACHPGAPNPQQRQTFVCPDISPMLRPGVNVLTVTFDLNDGRSVTKSVTWEVFGYSFITTSGGRQDDGPLFSQRGTWVLPGIRGHSNSHA